MSFNLDPAYLLLSLVTSGVGFVLFVYGRKQHRMPHLVGGILFTVYPYFLDSALALLLVGVLIAAGVWVAVRQGY